MLITEYQERLVADLTDVLNLIPRYKLNIDDYFSYNTYRYKTVVTGRFNNTEVWVDVLDREERHVYKDNKYYIVKPDYTKIETKEIAGPVFDFVYDIKRPILSNRYYDENELKPRTKFIRKYLTGMDKDPDCQQHCYRFDCGNYAGIELVKDKIFVVGKNLGQNNVLIVKEYDLYASNDIYYYIEEKYDENNEVYYTKSYLGSYEATCAYLNYIRYNAKNRKD